MKKEIGILMLRFIVLNSIILIPSVIFFDDLNIKKGIFYGWLLSLIAFVIGLISFLISWGKENKIFLKHYFGGIFLRLSSVLLLFTYALKFSGINLKSLLFSLFIFYTINTILELYFIINISNNVNNV